MPTTPPAPAETFVQPPFYVVWDITYTCPLRCTHCYSESGRRPARQLSHADMLRVTDELIALNPPSFGFAGGEPFVVKNIFEIIERIVRTGIEVAVFTSGWALRPWMIDEIVRLRPGIHVSVDAPTAEVHDRIRGRVGSFERAMGALRMLDDASRELRARGEEPLQFGIDGTIVRSSFDQLEQFCTTVAPQFPEMRWMSLTGVVPTGLASRTGYAEHELLTDEQANVLESPEHRQRLKSAVPTSVDVFTSDNRATQMHPNSIKSGRFFRAMLVEPDGQVRAMPIYEGTVGSLLTEPATTLWERAVARWSDPFVVETLTPVRTMADWAEATRRIDYHFGSDDVRARIDRRPEFLPLRIA